MIEIGKIHIKDEGSVVEARNKIRQLAGDLKFSPIGATRLATVTSMLSRSICRGDGGQSTIDVGFDRTERGLCLSLVFQSDNGVLDAVRAERFFDTVRTSRAEDGSQRLEALKHLPDPAFRPTEDFVGEAKEKLERPSRAELLEQLRKRNEELRESEELSRGILETAATGIYLLQDGVLQYVNRPFETLSGYSKEELLGRRSLDFVHPDDRETARTRAIEVLKGKRSLPYEFRFVKKDSELLWVLDWVTSILYKGKRAVLGTLMDITERKQAEEEIRRYTKRVEALHAVGQAVSQTSDVQELLDSALGKVVGLMSADTGCVFLVDVSKKALVLKAHAGVPAEALSEVSTTELTDEELQRMLEWRELDVAPWEVIGEAKLSPFRQAMEREQGSSLTSVPLLVRGRLLGMLCVGSRAPRDYTPDDMGLLRAIGNEVAVGIDNAMLLERTRELSITDELTGLYNRRHLYGVLESETYRSQRYGTPFCMVILDLDGFKEYNDKFGHTVGDTVLKAFAMTLKLTLRESDPAFRYGGDEFAIILPSTDSDIAKKVVDRIRAEWPRVTKNQHALQKSPVGFSAGIVQFPKDAETGDGLIFLADTALFRSKREGGNKSTVVSELGSLSADVLDTATLDQVYALAATVDARDPYTYGHSKRVGGIAEMIGKAIGLRRDELVNLHAAGLLHDIGKVGVPDAILTKPGKLEEHEWRIIKQHSAEGARIVDRVKDLAPLVPLIRHHHEWYNGTGYPDGLKAQEIPLGARIITVADAYDTMTTVRPYRNVVSHEEACAELRRCAGTQFAPDLVEAFERVMKTSPAQSHTQRG